MTVYSGHSLHGFCRTRVAASYTLVLPRSSDLGDTTRYSFTGNTPPNVCGADWLIGPIPLAPPAYVFHGRRRPSVAVGWRAAYAFDGSFSVHVVLRRLRVTYEGKESCKRMHHEE